MATFIQVEEPKKVWQEIRRLIDDTSKGKQEPFSKTYPEIYRLYLRISAYKREFHLGGE